MIVQIKLKNFVLMSSVLIAGCTPSFVEMRKEAPYASHTSSKSAKEVADCLLFEWQKDTNCFTSYGEIYMQPYQSNGFTVFSHGRLELADIYPEGGVTKVNFYYHGGFKYRIENKVSALSTCTK